MNQILLIESNHKKENKKYKFLLFFSILSIILFVTYELYIFYICFKSEKLSINLLNSFNIEKLYSSNNNDYIAIELNQDKNFFTIGIIEIPKINVSYPILSKVDDNLLKIAPCRFYGPYPNQIGNLCIAGHNYNDNRFFGNLNKLNIGDKISIYDSNKYKVSYYVYDKFEIIDSDTSCTNQNTNQREITLVTCNNFNKKRLIIKAKEGY